jgi:hypothetical protein
MLSDGLDIYMSMVEDTMRSIKQTMETVLLHYKGQTATPPPPPSHHPSKKYSNRLT